MIDSMVYGHRRVFKDEGLRRRRAFGRCLLQQRRLDRESVKVIASVTSYQASLNGILSELHVCQTGVVCRQLMNGSKVLAVWESSEGGQLRQQCCSLLCCE